MTQRWLSRTVLAVSAGLGLAGCVAYEPAPYYASAPTYYSPGPAYYGPAPSASLNFQFGSEHEGGDRDHGWHHEHGHWH